MRFYIPLAALVLNVLAPGTALANGRFPRAQQLLEDPRDPNHLYLAATFGLLETRDRGQHWYQICEVAFAGKQLEGDPLLEVLPNGNVLSGIGESLNLSEDCGCSFRPVLAAPEPELVIDISRQGSTVVALVRDLSTLPGRLRIDESTDAGKTFHKLADLPSEVVDGFTLDVAPSDPSRIYLSVAALPGGGPAALLVSKDRGRTFERHDIPGSSSNVLPFIAAVHPKDPDLVFVRTDNWDDQAEYGGQDELLVTRDAGQSFSVALHKAAKILGFALAPDGETVLAGYGDPQEPGFTTNPDDYGIYAAKLGELSFARIYAEPIACLRWTASGVYACVLQGKASSESALGFRAAPDFTLTTPNPLTSLLNLKEVRGPLACTGASCARNWQEGNAASVAVCMQLGASCTVNAAENVLSCPPDAGGAGGASGVTGGSAGAGTSGRAGSGGIAGSSGGSLASGGSSGAAGQPGRSSGCRVHGAHGAGGVAGAAGCLAALSWLFARRRRARR